MTESEQKKEHHAKHHAGKPQHETDAGKHKEQKEIRITLPEIKGLNLSAITTVAAVALLLIVVFQAFQAFTLSQKLDAMAAEAQELNRPAVIELTAISADCEECAPLQQVISTVEGAKVNITKTTTLESKDSEAQELVVKYAIKRLPTVVITGEVDRVSLASLAGFTKADDALIYSQQPPYVDAATGDVKGLVSLTYVNVSSCKECPDLMGVVQQLRSQVKVKEVKVVDFSSSDGSEIVKEFSMLRLPGILVSAEVNEYLLAAQLAQVGTVKKGGAIALGANPPYLNVSTGEITGVTQLILLNDSSCTGCYDVTMHVPIVRRFQVNPATIKVTDAASAEGKELISRYKITAVPTILVTGDVSPYQQLLDIWPTVGTTEKDGALVFRTMSAIAGRPYKDLTSGKVELNTQQLQQR
ncbi:hypothetical protein HYV83_05660 [Candidatus Woesearchaeota archaeon]|nr:hypothetical protein [Candidatus Woesearchaeota archaeon]